MITHICQDELNLAEFRVEPFISCSKSILKHAKCNFWRWYCLPHCHGLGVLLFITKECIDVLLTSITNIIFPDRLKQTIVMPLKKPLKKHLTKTPSKTIAQYWTSTSCPMSLKKHWPPKLSYTYSSLTSITASSWHCPDNILLATTLFPNIGAALVCFLLKAVSCSDSIHMN